jgi:hypothetical protein
MTTTIIIMLLLFITIIITIILRPFIYFPHIVFITYLSLKFKIWGITICIKLRLMDLALEPQW